MTPFSFATAPEILFGRGQARAAVPRLASLGRRTLLVCGSRPGRSDWLVQALVAEGVEVTVFSVAVEPDVAIISAGVAAAREASAQAVVAIGGGAVIDAGKAIAALVPATRPLQDHLEVVGRGLPLEAAPLPFAALPTTAGTGAEVTRNAVIGVPEAGRKVSIRDLRMLPRLAVVDPGLTDGCPRGVTLASGLDAIAQVIEPFVSLKANPMTDALCRDAIPRGVSALKLLMERENPQARDEMAWASLCGGMALANAGLGAVHGLAGPLGGMTGAAHGALCGVLLPPVLVANRARVADPARLDAVGRWIGGVFGRPDAVVPEAAALLARWSRDCGLPALETSAEQRMAAAEAGLEASSMKANPVALDREALIAVMEKAAGDPARIGD